MVRRALASSLGSSDAILSLCRRSSVPDAAKQQTFRKLADVFESAFTVAGGSWKFDMPL